MTLSIGDSGVENLKGMKELEWLDIASKLTSNGTKSLLENRCNLKYLILRSARGVGDSGMKYIACMTNLETLVLNHATITDNDLDYLRELVKLNLLDLSDTQITSAGLTSLQQRRRGTKIYLLKVRLT